MSAASRVGPTLSTEINNYNQTNRSDSAVNSAIKMLQNFGVVTFNYAHTSYAISFTDSNLVSYYIKNPDTFLALFLQSLQSDGINTICANTGRNPSDISIGNGPELESKTYRRV